MFEKEIERYEAVRCEYEARIKKKMAPDDYMDWHVPPQSAWRPNWHRSGTTPIWECFYSNHISNHAKLIDTIRRRAIPPCMAAMTICFGHTRGYGPTVDETKIM